MNPNQFAAESNSMMAVVNDQFAAMFDEEKRYFRICGENETLDDAVHEALQHGASVYCQRGRYFISTMHVQGARRIAPMFEPIRPLPKVGAI